MSEGLVPLGDPGLPATLADVAAEIKDSPESVQVRIAMVTAISSAVGRKVQTDQTGSAWLSRSEDTALYVGDRVWLLKQGSAYLVGGRLSGEPASVPIATILPFAGSSAPAGWMVCDGTAIPRLQYPTLYQAIGNGYGAGDGSTTFNLPDLRDRFPLGSGPGHFQTLTGGAATVTLTTAQIPQHDHGAVGGHTHVGTPGYKGDFASGPGGLLALTTSGSGAEPITSSAGGHTHAPVGSGAAHENMPPFLTILYIIRVL